MTKIQMPEPVAYQWLDTGHFRKKVPADADASAFRPLITTDQAEAYADARVRAALEEAAKILDNESERCEQKAQEIMHDEPDEVPHMRSTAWRLSVCARDIRALIPATK